MSARPILVVHAAPDGRDEDALELLRVAAALVACGHPVRLMETAPVLTGDDLPDEAERILEQLAAFDVVPEPFDATALGSARSVLRLGAADRTGSPPLAVGGHLTSSVVRDAGQIVR